MKLSKQLYVASQNCPSYVSLLAQYPQLGKWITDEPPMLVIYPYLAEDLLVLFYGQTRVLYPSTDRNRATEAICWICETFAEAPDFTKLKALCAGQSILSGFAVSYILEELLFYLDTRFVDLANQLAKSEIRWQNSLIQLKAAERVTKALDSLGQHTLALTYSRKVRYLWVQSQKWERQVLEINQGLEKYYCQHKSHFGRRLFELESRVLRKLQYTMSSRPGAVDIPRRSSYSERKL